MKKLIAGGLGLLMVLLSPGLASASAAVTTAHDCDDNAVVRCGASTSQDMQQKITSSLNVAIIYEFFGISINDLNNLDSTAQAGTVTKAGEVMVNGQTVATDAVTAGRMNLPGSTQITFKNVTFFKRPPSVSFAQNSLPAFVVMKNNTFAFAVIASCGNPVIATAVKKSVTPTPARTQPTAPVTPVATTPVIINQTQTQVQTQTQSQPAPTPTPVATVAQPTTLPSTGAAGVAVVLVSSGLLGTAGYQWFIRRRLQNI
jgi:hypothetical protein